MTNTIKTLLAIAALPVLAPVSLVFGAYWLLVLPRRLRAAADRHDAARVA